MINIIPRNINRIFIVLFFAFTVACNNKSAEPGKEKEIDPSVVNNPATASGEISKDNVPVLKFEKDIHDFGTVVEGEKVAYAFSFTNLGKGPLVIRAAQGSCGCTVPEFPKDPVEPGKGGLINVTFNSEGKEGMQDKTVTVISNTVPSNYVLHITGNVVKK